MNDKPPSSDRRTSLRKILKFIQPFRNKIIFAIVLTSILTFIGLAPPLLYRYFVDNIVNAGAWHFLLAITLARFAIPFLSSIISLWNTYIITYVGQKLVFDVRFYMYQYLLRLALRFHDTMGTGKIISRLMGDSSTVQNMVTWNTVSIVNDLVSFFFGLVMIFYISWKLSLIAIIVLPLYWINYRFFVKRIRVRNIWERQRVDHVYNTLQERISGTKLVRSYVKEDWEIEEFTKSTQEIFTWNIKKTVFDVSFGGVSQAIDGIANTVIFCLGCYYVIQGKLTYGDVTAFTAYVWRVLYPALSFSSIFNQFEQTLVSVDRIFEILDIDPEITEVDGAIDLPPIKGHVRFEDVCFEYTEGNPVLKHINLDIPPGTNVALVGHTGCGKTTLTSLLLRFYDTTSGRITIDGYDISNVTLRSLRQQIGQVLQDSVLFHATVRENIAYGVPQAFDEEIIRAAQVAEIHDFIVSKPDGYDSLIGGKGIKLSVGEKQRMSIARAVITNPGILILDEATSSLDSQSEALIQKALQQVMANRTSFVIAHRLSTIVNADLIVVLEKGEIVEMGTHEELLAKEHGFYKELYEEQHAAALEEADKMKW